MNNKTYNTGTPPSASDITACAQAAIAAHRHEKGALLPILHDIQHALRHIPAECIAAVAEALNLSRAEVHGVVTFYPHFLTQMPGRHVVEICRAESCQAMGGDALIEHARQHLGCDFDQTTGDGKVTLMPVYCLGLCAQSPSVMIDGRPHARMTPKKFDALLAACSAGTR